MKSVENFHPTNIILCSAAMADVQKARGYIVMICDKLVWPAIIAGRFMRGC
jgi:hypothetical protein